MGGKYQIIIVGAGPSGLSTALTLKKFGIESICVIEKHKFPRYKCCAGYITNRTGKIYEQFGLKIEDVNYYLIDDFNIFYNNNKKQTIKNRFLFTNRKIDRVELDNRFYEIAVERGIEILQDTTITTHFPQQKMLITSSGNTLTYEKIIFADGSRGYGHRYQCTGRENIAFQLIFKSDRADEIQIHFGFSKQGYGWVSSYAGITNIGLTDVYHKDTDYLTLFKSYLDKLGIQTDISGLQGAFTPIGIRSPILPNDMYFVGDAVGACDPLTLSGLRYALGSGQKCAEAIALGDDNIYLKYIRSLGWRFKFMYFILKLFYCKPTLFTVFNVGCKAFGGFIAAVFNNFFVNKK